MSERHTERLNAALEGRYRIERQLGEGGMATVYLADDLKLERKVALKVLKPELAAVVGAERFLAEIKTTANLQHPHILPLFDSGEADSFLFYVMPYVEGETLRDRLERDYQLPVDEAVRIASDVAEALHAAHQKGIVHRDIKPANILLSQGRPLVGDFGIALAVNAGAGSRLTETGLSVGTPHYMSPEQAAGDQPVGPLSDVYSLGCVLYEMLVGDPPHLGSSAQAVLAKILTESATAPRLVRDTVPAHLDAAIKKALEKVPADRFKGAKDFADALTDRGFRHAEAVGATERAEGWSRATAVLAALVVALGVSTAWLVLKPAASEVGLTVTRVQPETSVRRQVTFTGSAEVSAFSPDGSRIAFISQDSLGSALVVQALEAGALLDTLVQVESMSQLRWMSDGGILVLVVDDTLRRGHYRVHSETGEASYENPSYLYAPAPDGSGFASAYQATQSLDVFRGEEGGATSEETSIPFAARREWTDGLWWSPQAPVVVVRRSGGGANLLVGVNVETGEQWEYANSIAGSVQFSPQGDALYYAASGRLWELPLNPVSGLPTGPPISIASAEGTSARLTPDGQTVAFTRSSYESTVRWFDLSQGPPADHESSTVLASGPSARSALAVNSDGSAVVFWDSEPSALTILRPDGTAQERIRLTAGVPRRLAWSPSGLELAAVVAASAEGTLVRVPTDGSGEEVLLASPVSISQGDVAWCADEWLLTQDVDNSDYSILRRDGEPQGKVFEEREPGWMFSPVCAPDGGAVAFMYNKMGEGQALRTVDLESRQERLLVRDADAFPIGWSSDGGGWIYFYRGRRVPFTLNRVSAQGGEVEVVMTLPSVTSDLAMSRDASKLATIESRSRSDIWMIENFRLGN